MLAVATVPDADVAVSVSAAAVVGSVEEQPSRGALENVTRWSQSVTDTGRIPAGWIMVLQIEVVLAE